MKKLILLFVLALGVNAIYAQTVTTLAATKDIAPAFTWDEQTFDFGKIAKGTPVTHEFSFTNSGGAPLLIKDVKPSCGCTTPEWTKETINPGEAGYIKATYNAANVGVFNKTITIYSNTGAAIVLTIKGIVE